MSIVGTPVRGTKTEAGHRATSAYPASTYFQPHCQSRKLLGRNVTERSVHVVERTRSPEELVLLPVQRGASAKLNAPDLIDIDRFAVGAGHRANEFSGMDIEAIDVASAIEVVGNQQGVAERTEIAGCKRHSPWLVQWSAFGKMFHENAIFGEDIDDPARTAGGGCVGDQNIAINVLNAKRCCARRQVGVRERLNEIEIGVVDVDLIIGSIGGINHVPG